MVNEEPKVSDFARYSAEETCKLLGIHRNTLFTLGEGRKGPIWH